MQKQLIFFLLLFMSHFFVTTCTAADYAQSSEQRRQEAIKCLKNLLASIEKSDSLYKVVQSQIDGLERLPEKLANLPHLAPPLPAQSSTDDHESQVGFQDELPYK